MGTKTQKLSNVVDQIVEWQSVKTSDFTAVAGEGYFVNTTSGAVTVTLPASPKAGDIVQLKDYARTWGTNNVTTASALVDGATSVSTFSTNGTTVTLVYMDGTKGWSLINEDTTNTLITPAFISATGGTITTSGDYKIHSFTGDGCFVVSSLGNVSLNPLGGPNTVDYLVVAGGGGAGPGSRAGGGGAGGFRESHSTPVSGCYTASPLATPTGITVSATTYPITVGGGGAPSEPGPASAGSNSVFSTITSAGGGRGSNCSPGTPPAGAAGGSGGGGCGRFSNTGGTGNTPPTSPPQGNSGGTSTGATSSPDIYAGAGGGGAGTSGSANPSATQGGNGGNGVTTSISGSPTAYAGGGGGGAGSSATTAGTGGSGGPGGGGPGGAGPSTAGTDGTANTGGGGGGNGIKTAPYAARSGAGGKGIVIIRYKYQ